MYNGVRHIQPTHARVTPLEPTGTLKMSATSLYNLSPAVTLLGFGAAIGCLPLAWIWQRHRTAAPHRRRLALVVMILFLTFDLILVGAFTRLTDSGLGCPDWPGCYGHSNPLKAHAEITAAQTAMPTGPVTHQKAWIEMAHRYLASGVGALILVMAALAWLDAIKARALPTAASVRGDGGALPSAWWATATLVWVCIQGAFGALTVTMKLFPAIVSLHLLGAYALVALLVVQATQWARVVGTLPTAETSTLPKRVRQALIAALALLLLQATSGAWVSTNYAVLVCAEFPTCQGSWWPDMNFAEAFSVWRPLGEHADGSIVSFQALTAIHVMHRLLALLTTLALLALAWRFWRHKNLQRAARLLAGVLALQVATGLSNVVLDWPIAAAMVHSAGGAGLVAVLVWMLALTQSSQRPA
jgi:cytochrome c oxidase assembly protein subunit 15